MKLLSYARSASTAILGFFKKHLSLSLLNYKVVNFNFEKLTSIKNVLHFLLPLLVEEPGQGRVLPN